MSTNSSVRQPGVAVAAAVPRKPLIVALLLLGFVLPFYTQILGLRISGYRVVLIFFIIPAMIAWARGAAGPMRHIDFLVIFFAIWSALSLIVNHGLAAQWEFSGILVIETLAPYFIARVWLRDFRGFRCFVSWYFLLVMVLLPFAVYESLTGKSVILDFFGKFALVYSDVRQEARWGFERAQVSMPHPILFGVFVASALTMSWFTLGWAETAAKRLSRPFLVGLTVFTSFSSGAFMGIVVQILLIAWDRICASLTKKWNILALLFGAIYFFVEISSNRNVFEIFATHFTFSTDTAWNRIHIFNNASDDVMRNPLFGIGLGDWTRPIWLRESVDNFWLVITLRYGFPALLSLFLAVAVLFRQVGRAPVTGATASARTGYLIALFALCLSAVTVHLWDATYSFFMFLVGAGVWFVGAEDEANGAEARVPDSEVREIRYSRWPAGEIRPSLREVGR